MDSEPLWLPSTHRAPPHQQNQEQRWRCRHNKGHTDDKTTRTAKQSASAATTLREIWPLLTASMK